ncbi:glutaredoxin family protein [Ralstonia solanacearum]|uniref:glutaredoxin family protein n=1 Tax=Ralstonia solanacearum TaxID=305 RepID=UPI0001816B75|nr:glutaredoxin family protein [Ralstonia solanacearum]MDC6176873.1 glutaredoxin family protein [Ralstonia solanacearum]MDC6209063.1 glutaredoxin family protein [Ralstonia solanacearum]MDC6238671.1 glutaredoxin family protein [Ralstonia solanacearum]MDD7799263.1 glutaredoxin family protein [Ralstonia solanacearum]TYZ56112.1 glutaredoxin family protein [Ralstonia solanacearum]
MIQLTLYGRAYCHLCDDMKVALEPFRRDFSFVLHEVDVDSDPVLEGRFGERVPVLLAGAPQTPSEAACELCHYFLDAPAVQAWLAAQTVSD